MTLSLPSSTRAPDLSAFDDFRVISRDLTQSGGFTLSCILKDEMFFLPAFLAHYRALGVERFICLDDNSTDGTRDFLCAQPDCMVLTSANSFGDAPAPCPRGISPRMEAVWRNILLRKYSDGQWALHVDADEFLRLPVGQSIQACATRAEETGAAAVWGVMLDLYPETIAQLRAMRADTTHDPDAKWHYDARRHIRIKPGGAPKAVYPGVRARLMQQFTPRPQQYSLKQKLTFRPLRRRLTGAIPSYNSIQKPPLLKMPAGGVLQNVHAPDFPGACGLVLVLEHFKFTGQIYDRVVAAIDSLQHFNGSAEYRDMRALLLEMERRDASFLCPWSSSARNHDAYLRAGVAQGR